MNDQKPRNYVGNGVQSGDYYINISLKKSALEQHFFEYNGEQYVRLTVGKNKEINQYLASLTKRDYCFASNEHLVDTLKISDRTIYRVLNSLEDKELIKRVTNNLGGSYGKNRKIYVHPSAKKAYHSK